MSRHAPTQHDAPTPALLKVGELAAQAGLTVRTLHHYEDVGLLLPARRTPAGHRLYGIGEVRRLHQISSLRQMGLSLEEIGAALDDRGRTLEAVLQEQIRRLRAHILEEEALCRRLEDLLTRLESGEEEVSLGEMADSIGRTVRLEKYYSSEQLQTLARRAEALGEEGVRAGQDAWTVLLEDFATAMKRGTPPDHPRVGELAAPGLG